MYGFCWIVQVSKVVIITKFEPPTAGLENRSTSIWARGKDQVKSKSGGAEEYSGFAAEKACVVGEMFC
jgi:hypothetical protein